MMRDDATTHDEAIEALIAASLRVPNQEQEITEEDIRRYVEQQVTLTSEDEEALKKSRSAVLDTIREILHGDKKTTSPCVNQASMRVSEPPSDKHVGASDQFVEAVVIAQLTKLLSSPDYPLGRFRYNKFAYFSHRKAQEEVRERFLKKAAGPYSPWARYKGPEAIALRNGYVKRAGPREGLLPGDNICSIERYLSRYSICQAVEWAVEKFRYKKNEDLELLATVDLAALDVKEMNKQITTSAVKKVIRDSKEWKSKLSRAVFSDENIQAALSELELLFPLTYEGSVA